MALMSSYQRAACSLFCLLLCLGLAQAREVEVAGGRYPLTQDGVSIVLPYLSSHDLSAPNPAITRLVVAIHSSSYNPGVYLKRVERLLEDVPGEKSRTLVVAPHFLDEDVLPGALERDFVYWTNYPFRGSSKASWEGRKLRFSAFEAVDGLLQDLVAKGNYPNLRSVVILGHSAGGQMVNRYAAAGRFESDAANPRGIEVRYLVMAPSSYLYFSGERGTGGATDHFSVPQNPPKGYNDWGYGLSKLYSYHKRCGVTADWMIAQYRKKRVLYLVGSEDRDPSDTSLARFPEAMVQGRQRLERGQTYYNFLVHFFGDSIKERQRFEVVPGARHSGRELMQAAVAVRFVLGRDS